MIRSLKESNAEVVDFKKFKFDTRSFNPYEPHGLCRDHCVRVYYPWIHRACHWLEEEPWRHCYNSSRINEPVSIAVEWLAALKASAPQEATIIAATSNKPMQDKGKRKIVETQRWSKDTSLRKIHLWKRYLWR